MGYDFKYGLTEKKKNFEDTNKFSTVHESQCVMLCKIHQIYLIYLIYYLLFITLATR